MTLGKLYVVGLKGSGVLFVNSNPFRASIVTDAEILKYNSTHAGADGYARIAAAACSLIASNDPNWKLPIDMTYAKGVESLVASGVTICNADFALIADVTDQQLHAHRMVVMPLADALNNLSGSTPGGAGPTLKESVLSD
jgi:hypothetical protein